jgi:hypothetical protein
MYCTACGAYNGDNCKFCSSCGVKTAVSCDCLYDDVPFPDCCPPEVKPLPEPPGNAANVVEGEFQEPKQEQLFFGKKALTFCLVVIAIMSIAAGMFIGLYYNERTSANQGRASVSAQGF